MADAAAIEDLVRKMRLERGRLIMEVERLDEATASRVPTGKTGEEEWSVKEQLVHLWQMERAYDAWVSACLRDEAPDLGPIRPQPAPVALQDANARSVAELLTGLAAERERTDALIAGLSPNDFDRTGSHPNFGRLSVLQWLRSFYRHDRMHRDQIAGREPEYKPRFLSGIEPDQRVRRA
jgi:hypothetical protein